MKSLETTVFVTVITGIHGTALNTQSYKSSKSISSAQALKCSLVRMCSRMDGGILSPPSPESLGLEGACGDHLVLSPCSEQGQKGQDMQGQKGQDMQGLACWIFEYLQGRRCHQFSGQPEPVLTNLNVKKTYLSLSGISLFKFMPIASSPIIRYQWVESGFIFFTLRQVFKHIDTKSLLFSRLSSPSSCSLSSPIP